MWYYKHYSNAYSYIKITVVNKMKLLLLNKYKITVITDHER